MAFVQAQIVYRIFLVQTREQHPKTDLCTKFQPNWTKDEGPRISISKHSKNCLTTSYTSDSDDVINILMLLRDYAPKYNHAKYLDHKIPRNTAVYFTKIAQPE